MSNERHYDVIIIGTGAGGGTLARKLAPTGKRILILERGDYVPREKDNWSTRAVNVQGKYQTKEGAEFAINPEEVDRMKKHTYLLPIDRLIKDFEADFEIKVISCSELAHENSNRQFTIIKNNQNMKLSRIAADLINDVIMIDKLR